MTEQKLNRRGRKLAEAYRALGRQSFTTASGRRHAGNALTYGLAIALGISMLVPFLWMISTSLMDEFEVFRFPPRLLPSDPVWSNYPNALTAAPFGRFFINSAVMSLFIVSGHLITASTAGYAFARLRFPGRDKVFILFLANLMVPIIVLLIPRFLLVSALGWVDTYAGLIVTELVGVWGIFLMRQYFLSIPRELEDAARIDGASEWHVFWRVALPLAKPAIATVALFSFVETWKSFLWPLIVTRSMAMRPVEVGIAAFHSLYFSNWPYQMAAAVTAVIPILILFLFTQRYFVQGIQLAGLKY
ncbi:MAG: carbohydrate ABC transporter permease [Gemmatimonadota bacterium]|nr:MAG: carbohydrate ABC transporter permease [Gemmatimonadota bacterium]